MPENPHFLNAASWGEAAALVNFEPIAPAWTDGNEAQSFAVHVMDHKQREIDPDDRSLEIYYGSFSMSQSLKPGGEAQRWALEVSFGPSPLAIDIGGHEGRVYQLGPEPEPDDIDPRMPAVVSWYDGDLFYLVASEVLGADTLQRIAESCYPAG